jgi:prepilin-type N-terminal cleavage/methylation domain-containing protein
MQIFSPLHSSSFRSSASRGFSLIELLISTAIIVAIASLVLVRFSMFDSTTLLKGLAYEVAASLRQAQVYSISVIGDNAIFHAPFGVTFTPSSQTYTVFRYDNSDTTVTPRYDIAESSPKAQIVNTYTLGRSMEVNDLCVVIAGAERCDIARLDVSFRRPEFRALFYAVPDSGSIDQDTIEGANIKLRSRNGGDTWIVEVGLLGHISVCNAAQSNCGL